MRCCRSLRLDFSVDRLRQTYAVDNAAISQVTLLRIAKDAGLRARVTRLTWDTLLGPVRRIRHWFCWQMAE